MIDREKRIRAAFEYVWEYAPEQRERALAEVCRDDVGLSAEVLSLFEAIREAGDFLLSPPFLVGPFEDESDTHFEYKGRRVGPYLLQDEIGRGGMSVVYLGVRADEEYRQQVAVKLIWPNADTEELLRRFKQERQILADLNHPSIARLLDGGTDDQGWPYIVMEYIDGQPITTYCRDHGLSIKKRLILFQRVCGAVHFAHQHLVIHRDLKPSNILVTEDGQVKLLDFGVSKVLRPDVKGESRALTRTGLQWVTPEYASPEQMREETITPASDVYSLGVLLYEIITGAHPYKLQEQPLHEVIRIICLDDPPLPSARRREMDRHLAGISETVLRKTSRELSGDLDKITLMALRKDVAGRYGGVDQLNDDIERYLNGQPVKALGDKMSYRMMKFARRHIVGAAISLILLAVLFGVFVMTVRQAFVETARARAERRRSYALQMQQAMRDWEKGHLQRLQETLDSFQPQSNEENLSWLDRLSPWRFAQSDNEDLRGFEWRYLSRLTHREKWILPKAGYGMALSPDGKSLAMGKDDNTVVLWDLESRRQIAIYRGHTEAAYYQGFSPDGQRLVTGGYDDAVKIWESASGKEIQTLQSHKENISSVMFSPDGERILTGSDDHTARMWDAVSYQELFVIRETGDPEGSHLVAIFAANGNTFATMGFSRIKIWDTKTGRLLSTIRNEPEPAQPGVSPTNRSQAAELNGAPLGSMAFSPDGRFVAGVSDTFVKIWNTSTGRKAAVLRGHTETLDGVMSLAFSPDGRWLASGGNDRVIKLWDTTGWREACTIRGLGSEVNTLAFSPDSRALMCGMANHTVKIYDVESMLEPTVLSFQSSRPFGVAFAGGGELAVIGDDSGGVSLWNVRTGGVRTLAGHAKKVHAVVTSPDGRLAATASHDQTVKLWETATGREVGSLIGHEGPVRAVAFSNDGRRVATGSDDQTAKVWDLSSAREIAAYKTKPFTAWSGVWSVAFSLDDKLLVTGNQDGSVRLWNADSGQELAVLGRQTGGVWTTRFSPDGRLLAAGSGDSYVRIWDAVTWRERAILNGHSNEVFSLAFSPDGRRLATASNDGSIKLWDVGTAQELISFEGGIDAQNGHTDQVCSVAFSPDGQTLATSSLDLKVRLWRAATITDVQSPLRR